MSKKIKIKDKLEDDILDLSWCDLQEVPLREIATIKKASHLDLSNNQLVSIPKTIVTLSNIIKLDLSKNLLTEIPENIGEMKQLRHLDLYGNQISRLPLSLGELKNLKWLDLKENPLTPAVAKVAGPCSEPSECQHCARSIVSYLSLVKVTIEQEKQHRSNNAAITAADKQKKEPKKKKKKNNSAKDEKQNAQLLAASTDKSDATGALKIDSKIKNKVDKKTKSPTGLCGKICKAIWSTIMFTIFVGIIILLLFIILPRFDRNLSDKIVNYLQIQTNLPVRHYQKLGIEKFEVTEKYLIDSLKKSKVLLEDIYKKYSTSD